MISTLLGPIEVLYQFTISMNLYNKLFFLLKYLNAGIEAILLDNVLVKQTKLIHVKYFDNSLHTYN